MLLDNHQLIVKSRYLRSVQESDRAVIWHSLFGYPKIVSIDTLQFLDNFSLPRPLCTLLDEYKIDADDEAFIGELVQSHYLIPDGFDERCLLEQKTEERQREITTGSAISYLGLIMSEVCNFRCSYCIHFNNLETSTRTESPEKFMSFQMAKKAVDVYLGFLRRRGETEADINFGGGEPLLNWRVVRQAIIYCKTCYGQQFDFRFSINTNSSLVTSAIASQLKEFKVDIATSLDGLQEGNDKVRRSKNGRGTFELITRRFDILTSVGYPIDGFSATITQDNFDLLDEGIIDWAQSRGMSEVRIDLDVIGMIGMSVDDITNKLMRLRHYAHGKNINVFGFWSRPFENLNDSVLDTAVAFCGGARGSSLCVSPAGKIYPCGYSTVQIGQLDDLDSLCLPDNPYQSFVKHRFPGSLVMCRGCVIEAQCAGGCNITLEYARSNQTAKAERMCEFYRQMTQALLLDQLKSND